MEMHALLEEISALLEKIKSGTASLGELEAFAAATQQLNERAIILKYKAYEAKVFGTSAHFDSAQREPLSDLNSSLDEHSSASHKDLELKEETTKTEEFSVPAHTKSPEPIVEADEDLSFDLFSMDEDETIDEGQKTEDSSIQLEEEFVEETPEPSHPVNEEIIDEPAATFAPEIDASTSLATHKEEVSAPKIESAPISQAPSNEHPALRRARTNDGSLQSRLLSVRLETLKNAFGLNERILIVKELFGGDNDLYNATIDDLDNLNEVNSARTKMSNLAHEHGWREDSELAIEFIQKVERRYA